MKEETFKSLKDIIYKNSGIVIDLSKRTLLENRLRSRLRELNIDSFDKYKEYLVSDNISVELPKLIDVISTNTTSFYREKRHFDYLETIFKEYSSSNKRDVKMWCAAASSGEEPYTLSITANEHLNLNKTNFRMLATDINTKVLDNCNRGIYPVNVLKTVPENIKQKYFTPLNFNGSAFYKVNKELKDPIIFRRFNLIEKPYKLKNDLDIVFCRNVMIYFDNKTREMITNEIYRLLKPGGYLFISHSENLFTDKNIFEKVASSVFKKV